MTALRARPGLQYPACWAHLATLRPVQQKDCMRQTSSRYKGQIWNKSRKHVSQTFPVLVQAISLQEDSFRRALPNPALGFSNRSSHGLNITTRATTNSLKHSTNPSPIVVDPILVLNPWISRYRMIPLVKSCNHSTQHLQEVQWYSFKSQFSQRKLINHWNIPLFPSKVTPKNPITSIRPLNIPLNISTSVFNQSNDFPHDWWDFGLKSSQFYIPKFQDGSSFMGTNSSICQNPQQKSISFQSPHPLAPPLPPCRRTAAASAAAPRPPRQWWPAAAERRKCHGRRPGRWWHLAGGGKPMVDRKNGGKSW